MYYPVFLGMSTGKSKEMSEAEIFESRLWWPNEATRYTFNYYIDNLGWLNRRVEFRSLWRTPRDHVADPDAIEEWYSIFGSRQHVYNNKAFLKSEYWTEEIQSSTQWRIIGIGRPLIWIIFQTWRNRRLWQNWGNASMEQCSIWTHVSSGHPSSKKVEKLLCANVEPSNIGRWNETAAHGRQSLM